MLLDDIRADPDLAPFLDTTCCERDVCVDFDPSISKEDYVIIKVDDYYNAKVPSPDTPKSPDCLIILRCKDESFHIFIAELKNVKSQSGKNIQRGKTREKFHTCLTDFMSNRFRNHFYNTAYKLKLQLILVAGKVSPGYIKNFKLDFLLTMRPLQFANKFYGIQLKNPNPIVLPC